MKLKYTPEGTDTPHEYEWKPGKLLSTELELIEQRTGLDYPDWVAKVQANSMRAIRGFLFVMRKREDPTLKWDELVFTPDELAWELGDTEIRNIVDGLTEQLADDDLTSEARELIQQQRDDYAGRLSDETPASPGKSPSSEPATGSGSSSS